MNNVIRKALRDIEDKLMQLRDAVKDDSKSDAYEYDCLNRALLWIVTADTQDFHLGRKKHYVESKTNFEYVKR